MFPFSFDLPQDWTKWLAFVRAEAGSRMFAIAWLCGAFALRCSEALTLKREDISLTARPSPHLTVTGETCGNQKSPGMVYIRHSHRRQLGQYLRAGITTNRSKRHSSGKVVALKDHFVFPATGFIFRSKVGSGKPTLTYQAVWHQIKRLAPRFAKLPCHSLAGKAAKITSHSARATAITHMMAEGLSTAVSMKQARHKEDSVVTHLRYGQLMVDDVAQAMDGKTQACTTSASLPAQLAKLCDLQKQGLLTKAEFAKAKRKFLG